MGRIKALLTLFPESLMPRPSLRLFPVGPALVMALIATTLVAGCQLGQPRGGSAADGSVTPNAVTGEAIEVTALDAAPAGAAVAGAVPEVGPETGPKTGPEAGPEAVAADGQAPPQAANPTADPEATETAAEAEAPPRPAPPPVEQAAPKPEQQVLCEKRGGNWSGVGSGILRMCVFETRDNGKSCDRESDCEGVCLARSRTCAPVKPLLGCNEILQDDGARVTLCIE